ncbi:hypothetical protein D3C80_1687920 [compost metagenome]
MGLCTIVDGIDMQFGMLFLHAFQKGKQPRPGSFEPMPLVAPGVDLPCIDGQQNAINLTFPHSDLMRQGVNDMRRIKRVHVDLKGSFNGHQISIHGLCTVITEFIDDR